VLGEDHRYVVSEHLGDGTFGRVLACRDTETGDKVAVKVIKGVRRFFEHAEAETEVIRDIQRLDAANASRTVDLRNTFVHRDKYFCMVFEPLDVSLRDFLKANNSQGLLMSDVRQISLQLLKSLEMLHSIGLVHCDLKCRNVMLRDASADLVPHPRVPDAQTRKLRNPFITIIDFGGAVFEEDRHNGRIGTRQFRAPEVVLGLHWNEKADMWSAGCIITMLYLGQRIFSMHEDMEFFAICEKALGTSLPSAMVASALEEGQLEGMTFDKDADGQWVSAWPGCAPDEEAVKRVEAIVPLRERVCERHGNFLSLVASLLEMDPERRWAASRSCQCQFFADHPEPQE
jgi:serine/threonine protein kinase